jgi:DNA-binding CsgD family transcriptional regulator
MALLGRESELVACLAGLDGSAPSGVAIVGEPGIGKTSLFRAVVEAVARTRRCVLVTTGLSAEADVPLVNLADLLDSAAGEVLSQLPVVQADALRVALRLASPTAPIDESMIARATVNTLRALASDGLLVAVDDEHWLDPDTRRVLTAAITWLPDAPIVWLVSVRTGHADVGLTPVLVHELSPRATRVDLARLDDGSLRRLILDRFSADWSPRLINRILDLAAGNPYTALELARETLASFGRDAATVRVPTSLAGSLNARLRRLSPAAQAIVQAAAVAAHPTRSLLRAILHADIEAADIEGMDVEGMDVDAAVDAAVDSDVLDVTPPDPVLRFTHPLLREVALASVSRRHRRRLHRALAGVVQDNAEAAGHLAAGADEPDESIAAVVATAAEEVAGRGAPARAAVLAEAALALSPDPAGLLAWRRRVLVLDLLERSVEIDRVRDLAEKWAAENPPDEVRGYLTFFRGLLATSEATMVELMTQAVDEQVEHDPVHAAHAGALLAHILSRDAWRDSDAEVHARRAVRTARRAGNLSVLRWALAVEADLAARRGDPDAETLLRDAVALPGWDDMPLPVYSPEMALAWWHLRRGEPGPARPWMQMVLDASERVGRVAALGFMHRCFALLEWVAGRWDQSERHALLFERHTPIGYFRTAVVLVANWIAAGRGQVDDARTALAGLVRDTDADNDLLPATLARAVLGQLELSVDDPAAAVGWLDPIAGVLREHAFGEPGLVTAVSDLIESYARVGRTDDATAHLDWFNAAAARRDNPWARITGGRAAAVLHLALGNPATAADAVEPAATQAREHGLPLDLGRCLLTLGTAQRRTRQRRTAAHTLDEAITVFDGLGAQRWANLARAERTRLTHAAEHTLTPAEQRISELVAQGRTNAEIAAILLVSIKTVEGTLTRIYRKLGVRSRVELARRAGP